MSVAEFQYMNGFRAGLLSYTQSFMQIGQCTVELEAFEFSWRNAQNGAHATPSP